ncbi:hypothetical protein GUF51_15720, partial [Xanthomonas citri pv. citri]|nr:hypothetical protein [Xanthomonas citri pv. citri]
MLVRLRSRVGTWRHEVQGSCKVAELVAKVEHERGVKILALSRKPDYSDPIQASHAGSALESLGIKH